MMRKFYDGNVGFREKTPNDFVSEVDIACEREIIHLLQKAYPHHSILSEERGMIEGESDEFCWLIDPLDGTTNFLHRLPHFAVSIALRQRDEIIVGVVYDPNRNELFSAEKGRGARFNDTRMRVSGQMGLRQALLGTGIPYQHHDHVDQYVKTLGILIKDTAGIRRAGAASLDLAYVACGRLDGFWEYGLRIWDIAAGVLLVTEAGGRVGDLSGGENHLDTGDTLAASPKVYEEMVERIAKL